MAVETLPDVSVTAPAPTPNRGASPPTDRSAEPHLWADSAVALADELSDSPSPCWGRERQMDMGTLARSMRARMPWPVGQRVLRENGLPRGRGWENTVARLSSEERDYSDKVDTIAQGLKEHLLCGEKLVRFYEVNEKTKATMVEALLNIKPPESPFEDAYPALLSENELEAQSMSPILIAVEELEDGVAAVFASVRSIAMREQLAKEELPDDAIKALAGYDEIVGIKHVRLEAIDVVSFPTAGSHINVRIDYPTGMHRDVGEAAQTRIRTEIATLVKSDNLSSPINLFPLINEMYKAQNEGTVVELAFGTTTASLKHEKMRRRAACLRKEAYHRGGKAALSTPIEPYRLSIMWTLPLGELNLS
jgi:hypothetical protein